MKKIYTVGYKITRTEYYTVEADNENRAREIAQDEGEFLESEADRGEVWIEEVEELEGADE